MAERKISKRLRKPYRMVIMNDETFEVKTAIRLTPLNLGFLVAILIVIGIGLATAVFSVFDWNAFSLYSINNEENNAELRGLLFQVDSLNEVVEKQDVYLGAVQRMVTGDYDTSMPVEQSMTQEAEDIVMPKPVDEDSILRSEMQNSAAFLNAFDNYKRSSYSEILFAPVKSAIISQSFAPSTGHNGVDIVIEEGTRIFNIAEGNVVFSDWTQNSGYMVIIAHENNFYSIYKHNKVNLVKSGDKIIKGGLVALSGASGAHADGPHLHFELWKGNVPVNPATYFNQFN